MATLNYAWVFWFMHRKAGSKIKDYNNEIKTISPVTTVEEFWGVYSRLKRPGELQSISDYHFFKQNIQPVWEDNLEGGKWMVFKFKSDSLEKGHCFQILGRCCIL
jgi:translation initiation factor 4E